jgi:hypothetical protein
MERFLIIDQAENDGAGGGAGGAGSQAGGAAAGVAAAAGAAAAGAAGAGEAGAAGGAAGAAGAGAAGAEEAQEYDLNGNKVKLTKAQLVAELMKAQDYTKKTQMSAAERKKYQTAATRADQIAEEYLAELKKLRGDGGEKPEPEPEDKFTTLEKRQAAIEEQINNDKWEKTFNPIRSKFPELDDLEVAARFSAAVKAGEAENSPAGLLAVAEVVAKEQGGKRNQMLETELAKPDNPLAKNLSQKAIDAFLKNPEDPKHKAFRDQVIADYVAGKIKLSNAGGDNGAGGGAGAAKKDENLEAVGRRIRESLRET